MTPKEDCQYRGKISGTIYGVPWESPEDCCHHENFPSVEFPKGSGHRDPLYCRVAVSSNLCPRGVK